jgi:hypothetical protein
MFLLRVRVYSASRHAGQTVLPNWVRRGRRARGDFKIEMVGDMLGRFISCLSRTVKEIRNDQFRIFCIPLNYLVSSSAPLAKLLHLLFLYPPAQFEVILIVSRHLES